MTNFEAEKLEAQKRFDALPENLKREVQADKNVKLIQTVCQDYSIPENKVKYVTMLVGEVFLGYIKPEEVAHELNTYFDIDLQKSNFIEIELKQKLFNGLKADLDKIYNPLSADLSAEALLRPSEASSEGGAKEEAMEGKEEVSPTIIKLEPEIAASQTPRNDGTSQSLHNDESFDQAPSTPLRASQDKKISPLTIGNIPTAQPTSLNQAPSSAPLSEAMAGEQDKPFIIEIEI